MELKIYFQMLRRGWWLVVLTTLIALATSLGVSSLITPEYTAVARFILAPSDVVSEGPDTVLQGLNTLDKQSVMITYAEIMKSNRIYEDALAFLHLHTEDVKEYTYTSAVLPSSSVLELSVVGPDPEMAAKIANAIGYQTISYTRRLNQVINLDFLDAATLPVIPSRPQPLRDASLATLLGLICGAALAIIQDQLRLSFETLRQRINLDNETGVYTHKYFTSLVDDELMRNPEDLLSVGIVELKGLKDIVDTYPIVALQRILIRVTESLRKELRGNDIVGRWNDFSFVVMLPNTSGAAANRIFERIYQVLSEPVDLGQLNIVVNLNPRIGGAEYGNHITLTELFEKATSALEQASRDNMLPVCVWEIKSPFWSQKGLANP